MSNESEDHLAAWARKGGFLRGPGEEYFSPEQRWQRKHAVAVSDAVEQALAQVQPDILSGAMRYTDDLERQDYTQGQVELVATVARLAFEAGIRFSQSFNQVQGDTQ